MAQLRAVLQIPVSAASPRGARHAVAALLDLWRLTAVADDAELVVSELITNAYRHAPGTVVYELEVLAHDDRVRISLTDGSAIRPIVAELNQDQPGGRGMRIIETLAHEWGAEDHQGGKRVWLDLLLPVEPGRFE
jgi:anti-sigma regulatory factor (Ser/Thr protein kinase)